MLDKTYNPAEVETRLYEKWEDSGAFAAGGRAGTDADVFSIVIPPPNVTGSLHMGHALNNTLQDVLTRYMRMKGRDTLWQPGMDHAGIATQMVVERQLAEEGIDRRDLGREEFEKRVWQWKEQSGGAITGQLRRLGASCDWSRERFTMDEGLSEAVLTVFIDLYEDGLIYKDKRLVNWDPKLKTAISDLEVEQRDVNGHLWHIDYPIEGEDGRTITVATTRPETMLGDTGVAVHPDDGRYAGLIGKHAILPLVGRKLPIVADDHADPEQGTGAVKITPAHDFNDFEVGRRHDLEQINILDEEGRINDAAPAAYRGLDRFEARERIVEDLKAEGVLRAIEDHAHTVPYGDRSGVVIEPWLTDQWYVDAGTLAGAALEAVKTGETRFVPDQWKNTYFRWMEEIQPWCISRQLWWGHRIPAWYGPDGEIFVAHDEDEAAAGAKEHYGKAVELERDPDVLDTWFSSALWPFSTLGWPEKTAELDRYYPTSVLITGFDIIFFWVARMMMMGLHFMKDVPFPDVYIHALVRDAQGRKMSKSKGNVIDPIDLIDRYGADALRFTLSAMAAPGRDIKLDEKRIEGYRNFATKLWNAARFCEMNECRDPGGFDAAACTATVNRWIVHEVGRTVARIDKELADYRFDEAANAIYHFIWGTFCDWYIEFSKPLLQGGDEDLRNETRACAGWALDQILKLLHPFMPFLTEELWGRMNEARETLLILAPWPDPAKDWADEAAAREMDWVIELISGIRGVRAELNVPAGAKMQPYIATADKESGWYDKHETQICRLAKLQAAKIVNPDISPENQVLVHEIPDTCVTVFVGQSVIGLDLEGVIDIGEEQARLKKEIEAAQANIDGIDKKLANKGFTENAPAEVVEETRRRREEALAKKDKLAEALQRLGG